MTALSGMNPEPASEIAFASGAARVDAFGGFCALVYGGIILWLDAESALGGWLLAAVGICLLWRGFRSWRKPYVRLTGELMVVFDYGRPKHYVPFNAIAAVERGFNRTRLLMRDGLTIHVSHLGFASGAEVERFRAELLKRISGGVG